jgi:hypothetical protein
MRCHDRTTSFLVPRCQLQQAGRSLLVTLPAAGATWRGGIASRSGMVWTRPFWLPAGGHRVAAQAGDVVRLDRAEYPWQLRYRAPVTCVDFAGRWCFGRVPRPRGWTLQLCASVESTGVPEWEQYDAVEILAAPQPVAVEGPAQPMEPPPARREVAP